MNLDSIKIIVCDVDGCLTDGCFSINEEGVVSKSFHNRDIYALHRAYKDKFKILIITGSNDYVISSLIKSRYSIISGSQNKFEDLNEYLLKENLTWENVAYIGDSGNDLECLSKAFFAACPSDALPEILEICNFSSNSCGGKGAVYEIIRLIYKLKQIKWEVDN